MTGAPPGARICSGCEYLNYGPQANCLNCGTALPAPSISLPGTVILAPAVGSLPLACPTCGHGVSPDDSFCTSCGTRLR